jgi:hypothetical protein
MVLKSWRAIYSASVSMIAWSWSAVSHSHRFPCLGSFLKFSRANYHRRSLTEGSSQARPVPFPNNRTGTTLQIIRRQQVGAHCKSAARRGPPHLSLLHLQLKQCLCGTANAATIVFALTDAGNLVRSCQSTSLEACMVLSKINVDSQKSSELGSGMLRYARGHLFT